MSRKKNISSQKFRFFFQGGNLKNKIRFSLFIDFLFMYSTGSDCEQILIVEITSPIKIIQTSRKNT